MPGVKWTRSALANLDEQARYIASDDPEAARRTVARIAAAAALLAAHPAMGRPGRVAGTRELVVAGTPFIIPYRVTAGTVEILRVLHTSRRWPPVE
ncbi:MAG: type II toxin-antitoxin system RelE/ParE family toxin [Nitrospinae bacterium]|nr:type II toxin-antitoxin system RelE/ParE family toxin [Nitrospinota bacterium]